MAYYPPEGQYSGPGDQPWQEPNPYAAAPYREPEEERPRRRFNRWWLFGLGGAVVALIIGVAVVGGGSDKSNKDAGPTTGSLSEQWRQGSPVSVWATTIVDQVVVAIECNQRGGPFANGAQCLLRGRSMADGRELWTITDQPIGPAMAAVGNTVVVTGDAVSANVRDNTAGNQQAHRNTLLINAADGRVIKTFENQVMWRYSRQTAVLRDVTGASDAQTFTAVDAASGAVRWQFAATVAPMIGTNGFSPLLPSGLAPEPFSAGDLAVMTSKDAVVVRKLDTGEDVSIVPRQPDDPDQFVTVVGNTVIRKVPGTTASLRGSPLNNPRAQSWTTTIPTDAVPVPCGDVVCVNNQVRSSSLVVNPANGRVVAKHGSGAMFAYGAGNAVAVIRCTSRGSITDPCPLKDVKTEVVAIASGKRLWEGDAPVMVSALANGTSESLVVGVTKVGANTVTLVAFPDKGKPAKLGDIDRVGLVAMIDVQAEPVSDSYAPTHLPTLVCAARPQQLVCGSRWLLTQPVSWKFTTTKASGSAG